MTSELITQLQRRVEFLAEALDRYGQHHTICAMEEGHSYCTCGFWQTLTGSENALHRFRTRDRLALVAQLEECQRQRAGR